MKIFISADMEGISGVATNMRLKKTMSISALGS